MPPTPPQAPEESALSPEDAAILMNTMGEFFGIDFPDGASLQQMTSIFQTELMDSGPLGQMIASILGLAAAADPQAAQEFEQLGISLGGGPSPFDELISWFNGGQMPEPGSGPANNPLLQPDTQPNGP